MSILRVLIPIAICLIFQLQAGAASDSPIDGTTALGGCDKDYVADLDQKFVDSWPASRLPIKVFVDPAGQKIEPDLLEIFQSACGDWSAASDQQVTFQFVQDPTDAQLKVNFVDLKPELCKELGRTRICRAQDGIKSVMMSIYKQKDGKPISISEMKQSCLHQVGHALGIQGHSSRLDDIMSANYVVGDTPADQIKLSQRDIATARKLYASEKAKAEPTVESK